MGKMRVELKVPDGEYCNMNGNTCKYITDDGKCLVFGKCPTVRTFHRIGYGAKLEKCIDAEVKNGKG